MSLPDQDISAPAVFTIARTFPFARQRVWDAFTEAEQLARWFGPKGTVTTVLSHHMAPGGMLHYCMNLPDGSRMYGRSVYREMVEPTRLVWVNSFADAQANIIRAPFFEGLFPLEMLTTVVFAEAGSGTHVTLTWTPLGASDAETRTVAQNKPSFHAGWTGSFDQLEAFLS